MGNGNEECVCCRTYLVAVGVVTGWIERGKSYLFLHTTLFILFQFVTPTLCVCVCVCVCVVYMAMFLEENTCTCICT